MLKLGKILLNMFVVILGLTVTLLWFRENNLFVISGVKIEGNTNISTEKIYELADIDFTREIFNIDLKAVSNRIKKHELVADVKINRYLPSAIKIKIIEKDLIAVITQSKLFALDVNSEIVETDNYFAMYDLPVVTGVSLIPDSLGNLYAPPAISEMVNILTAIREINLQLYHDISEINFKRNYGALLFLKQKPTPIILGFDDYPDKVYNLSLIYDLLRQKDELYSLESIDVRFKGQVVVKN